MGVVLARLFDNTAQGHTGRAASLASGAAEHTKFVHCGSAQAFQENRNQVTMVLAQAPCWAIVVLSPSLQSITSLVGLASVPTPVIFWTLSASSQLLAEELPGVSFSTTSTFLPQPMMVAQCPSNPLLFSRCFPHSSFLSPSLMTPSSIFFSTESHSSSLFWIATGAFRHAELVQCK